MWVSVAGKLVPFQPRILWQPDITRLSKRIGLRTVGSIGGKALCKVNIVVQRNTTPNPTHMVQINGVNYHNGDTAILELGNYSLTWASGDGGVFGSWGVSGNISVEDPNTESTTLTVTCGGTLTLNLILCPSGEQIINGGFEEGTLGEVPTGWTAEVAGGGYVVKDDFPVRTGLEDCELGDVIPGGYSRAVQTLAKEIPVACVQSFKFYANCYNSPNEHIFVILVYKDETEERFDLGLVSQVAWSEHNILPHLHAGKILVAFKIENTSVNWIDIDDVSLIGAG